ncbi:MAG TPA: hypothetical protein VIJ82_20100 [Streptosporangiaceae bacterium]|jgi:hypothetical protein
MNPSLLGQVSQQHITDMQHSAAHWATVREAAGRRTAESPRAGHPATIRNRAGWTLVQIGLRLASSGDA